MVRISNSELVKVLMENARIPFMEIARRLGVSEAAVRKRILKLEKEGVIKRYTVEVDPRKLGYQVDAFIGLDTKPEYYIRVLRKLRGMGKTVNLYSSSGDHMILLRCWLRDSEELAEFVKKLEAMEGVVKVCPAIILEKIK